MWCVCAQVNAQVLASTFSPGSHQWIKLGEAIGVVLKSCTTSKQPFSQVQITTQGKHCKALDCPYILQLLHFFAETAEQA